MRSLFALILSASIAVAAQQTVTHQDSSNNADGTLSIPQFNPSLGHLIKAEIVASIDSLFWCEATPVTYPPSFEDVLFLRYDAFVDGIIDSSGVSPVNATFGSPGALTYPAPLIRQSESTLHGNALKRFIGTGFVDFDFSIDVHFDPDPMLIIATELDHATTTVTITYTYN